MTHARHAASPHRQRGIFNIGVALMFIALIGCTGVALDVAQLRRQNAVQYMASARAGDAAPHHLHAKEPQ